MENKQAQSVKFSIALDNFSCNYKIEELNHYKK